LQKRKLHTEWVLPPHPLQVGIHVSNHKNSSVPLKDLAGKLRQRWSLDAQAHCQKNMKALTSDLHGQDKHIKNRKGYG
jgi:hypothetical protein